MKITAVPRLLDTLEFLPELTAVSHLRRLSFENEKEEENRKNKEQGEKDGYEDKTKNPEGVTFFNALAGLRTNDETRVALDRRVQALLASRNLANTVKSITQLTRILKSSNRELKVDYAQLAQDLFLFETSFEMANRICLKWGQQYYWQPSKEVSNSEDKN